jgi:hypothetical protein
VEKATKALRIGGVLAAAVSGTVAVMDLIDAQASAQEGKYELKWLQRLSGINGLAAASLAVWAAWAGGETMFWILSLTGWGVVLAIVLTALATAIDKLKGDRSAQWLERSYWGSLPLDVRYASAVSERDDFTKLMVGA